MFVCIEISTGWNSTYMILETAQKFERAFIMYEKFDPYFKHDLEHNDSLEEVPIASDWANSKKDGSLS